MYNTPGTTASRASVGYDRAVVNERRAARRVAAIGDPHAEDRVLEVVLDHVRSSADVDAVLCTGDVVDGHGDVDRCCALLGTYGAITVRGNHERWLLAGELRTLPNATMTVADETRAFLEALPATFEIETVAGRLMLCHGVGEDDMADLRPDTYGYGLQSIFPLRELQLQRDLGFALGGHTHQRMVRGLPGLTFLNAGTLARGHEPGIIVVDFDRREVELFDVDDAGRVARVGVVALPVPAPLDGAPGFR